MAKRNVVCVQKEGQGRRDLVGTRVEAGAGIVTETLVEGSAEDASNEEGTEEDRSEEEGNEERCCDDPCVVERDGTWVCLQCGSVADELSFDPRGEHTRDREGHYVPCSARVGDEDLGPRAVIAKGNKDARGHQLSSEADALFRRLRKRDKWSEPGPRRNLRLASRIWRGILSRLGFRDPRKISWAIIRWVAKHKVSQGRTLEATTAAAVYVAAVEQGFPVTAGQVCAMSQVRPDALRRVVSMYLGKRPAGWADFPVQLTPRKYFTPGRHIRKICTELGLTPGIATQAEAIARYLQKRALSGHRPETKAAACVMAAGLGTLTWQELARATGVQAPSLKAYWQRVVPLFAGAEAKARTENLGSGRDRGAADELPLTSDWRHHAGSARKARA